MASRILTHYKQKVDVLELVPGGGGCFEIDLDGAPLYSKLKTGSFPDEEAILAAISQR